MTVKEQLQYDVPMQPAPEQAFGVETEYLRQASSLIGNLAVHAPESLKSAADYAQKADTYSEELLSMAPLIEQTVRQEPMSVEDVRPHRAAIKSIARQESRGFRWLERGAKFLSFFGIHAGQRKLNAFVEQQFIKRVPAQVDQMKTVVKEKVEQVGGVVDSVIERIMPQQDIPDSQKEKRRSQPTFDQHMRRFADVVSLYAPQTYQQMASFFAEGQAEDPEPQSATSNEEQKPSKLTSEKIKRLYARWQIRRLKKKNRSIESALTRLRRSVELP